MFKKRSKSPAPARVKAQKSRKVGTDEKSDDLPPRGKKAELNSKRNKGALSKHHANGDNGGDPKKVRSTNKAAKASQDGATRSFFKVSWYFVAAIVFAIGAYVVSLMHEDGLFERETNRRSVDSIVGGSQNRDLIASGSAQVLDAFFNGISSRAHRPRRPSVLLLEGVRHRRSDVLSLIQEICFTQNFTVITRTKHELFSEDVLSKGESNQPMIVLALDFDRSSKDVQQSYYHILAATSHGSGEKRRSLSNVGFLFLGFSFESQSECKSVLDMYEYGRKRHGWSDTLVTRLTSAATIC